ncbi:TolC family protein [Sandarakinorhabdus sp. AAP62]|uniref:TolC family protein n=1 Tax=Sandarakinorhabdus sp. AAP62 TaxID=1248916 RepID=UPI0002D6B2A5|nr:TolC family protein [Sandarakinorhabdus sp. AAP62]
MIRALCLFVVAVLAAPATGQTVAISIDALAAEIVAGNPERQFLARQISLAQTGAAAAGRFADPEISVEFGERRTDNPLTGQRLGDGPAFVVSILQPIEFNGRLPLRKAIAQGNVTLARIGLAQFDATLAARARTLGYRLFAADARADAAAQVAGRMRVLAAVLVARDPAGPAPAVEAAVLEAAAITAERSAAEAQAAANAALYELNALRGQPFPAKVRILRPPPAPPPLPDVTMLAEQVEAGNFELLALKAQLEQQGLGVRLAEKGRVGALSIGPFINRDRGDVKDQVVGLRATTTLPLWNRQEGDVAAAESRAAQGEAALIAARRRLLSGLHADAALYRARSEALAKWPADAPQRFADAAAEADRAWRLGAVPLATYVQMQTGWLDALAAVLETRAGLWEARENIRVATGGGAQP